MKKKRTEKRTKRRDDGNKPAPRSDEHHNCQTPCCDLIKGLVAEIFPSVALGEDDRAGNGNKASGQNESKTDSKAAAAATEHAKEQPLLGFMIQQYLLEQHQSLGRVTKKNGSSESKSTKKKKKKKKKASVNADSNGDGESAVEESAGRESVVVEGERGTGNDQVNEPVPDNANFAQSVSQPPSNSAAESPRSRLDIFLDSLLEANLPNSPDQSWTNRQLESFSSYLANKYETCIRQKTNPLKTKKKDAESSETDLTNILPTISLEELTLHTSSINCRPCQTSVNSQMKQLYLSLHQTHNILPWGITMEPSNEGMFVLDDESVRICKRSSLTVAGFDDERAFDYVSMDDDLDLEAGNAPAAAAVGGKDQSTFRLEFYPLPSSGQDAPRFLQMKQHDSFPLSLDDIVKLVKSVILSCGVEIGADESDNAQLSDEDFDSITKAAYQQSQDLVAAVLKIHNMKGQMQNHLNDAMESNNRTTLDSTTASHLNSCNVTCEVILKSIGELLISITKMTCFVGWRTNDFGPRLVEVMVNCWSIFNTTLDKLIHPTMKYRGGVLQLCKRPGQVPIVATSKMMRDRFIEYLSVKVAMIEKLISYLDENLINPKHMSYRRHAHQAPSPISRLCVLEAFMSYSYKVRNANVPNIFPSAYDETEFAKLLEVRIRLSQQVIQGANKKNIDEKEGKLLSEIKTLYASIVKTVVLKENDYRTAPDYIKDYHDRVAREREKADRQLQSEPEEYSPETIAALMNTSQLLTMQWIYVLCMRQSYSNLEFRLPKLLDDWMESIEGNGIAQAPKPSKDDPVKCDGAGQKRRVSCVFSVLLYRWLEARCSEWHAELTQNELLTAVEVDESVAIEVLSKSSKKKKKKKSSDKSNIQDDTANSTPVEPKSTYRPDVKQIAERQIEKTELQPSSPNAVDDDIDEAVDNLTDNVVKDKSVVCSIDRPSAKSNFLPTKMVNKSLQDTSAQNIQPASKTKKKAKKNTANGSCQESTEVQNIPAKPIAVKVGEGNHNLHTSTLSTINTGEFMKVNRNSANNTSNNNATPSNGSSNEKSQPMQKNNIQPPRKEPKQMTANAKEGAPAAKTNQPAAKAPPSAAKLPSQAQNVNSTSKTEIRINSKPPSNSTSMEIENPTATNSSKAFQPSETMPAAAKSATKHTPTAQRSNSTKKSTSEKKLATSSKLKVTPSPMADQTVTEQKSVTSASKQKSGAISQREMDQIAVASDPEPRVGVIDYNGQYISAEDFLVGRMNALLAEIKEIKSRYTLWY